MFAVTLMH